jgi:FtsZ-interacting cell division protein ZipA
VTLTFSHNYEDTYKYKVGMSKYGLWLSRKKKLIFIPDSPRSTTSTMTTSAAEENNDNINCNGNNNNNQVQEQFKEQQQPQQQQQAVVYLVSIKIDQNSSGKTKINIHMYGVDPDATKDEAIRLFVKTQDVLKGKGSAVLESNSESNLAKV